MWPMDMQTQICVLDKKSGKLESIVARSQCRKASSESAVLRGTDRGGVVMSMGYALREQYPIDENCKTNSEIWFTGIIPFT